MTRYIIAIDLDAFEDERWLLFKEDDQVKRGKTWNEVDAERKRLEAEDAAA